MKVIAVPRCGLQGVHALQGTWGGLQHTESRPQCQHYKRGDWTEVNGQVLSKLATGIWERVVEDYQACDAAGLTAASHQLLALLADLDALLSAQRSAV